MTSDAKEGETALFRYNVTGFVAAPVQLRVRENVEPVDGEFILNLQIKPRW